MRNTLQSYQAVLTAKRQGSTCPTLTPANPAKQNEMKFARFQQLLPACS